MHYFFNYRDKLYVISIYIQHTPKKYIPLGIKKNMHSKVFFSFLFVVSSLILQLARAGNNYVICVESSGELTDANAMATTLTSETPDTWTATNGGGSEMCRTMLLSGTAHLYESDAGKAYGMILDSNLNSGNVHVQTIGKVGGGYTTMAVARKDKIASDGIESFCDIIDNGSWRAGHTGFMKSAGWIAPMGALQACANTRPSLQTHCQDLTQTGVACHQASFGNSCVASTPDVAVGDTICAQCYSGNGTSSQSCSDAGYYDNYYGAALCLLEGNCDIAFVKSTTMNCPLGADCLPAQADGVGDSKSVYQYNYAVPGNTYQAIPGYGTYVPSHFTVVSSALSDASLSALRTALITYGYMGETVVGVIALVGETHVETLERSLGSTFMAIMRNMPYFFEKNLLTRPSELMTATYAISDTDTEDDATETTVAVILSVLLVLFVVFGCVLVVRERQGNPVFYKALPQKAVEKSVVLPATSYA